MKPFLYGFGIALIVGAVFFVFTALEFIMAVIKAEFGS